MVQVKDKIALWALTDNGARGAQRIRSEISAADIFLSAGLPDAFPANERFGRLSEAVSPAFTAYSGHVFFMSTGIVVRMIAPLIRHKTTDPAIVVVDENCRFAISLLAGHIGGANDLALQVAEILGAQPVITTATDVNQLPAIDVVAKSQQLLIENPTAIKSVNMAFLKNEEVVLFDPYRLVQEALNRYPIKLTVVPPDTKVSEIAHLFGNEGAGVFVADSSVQLPSHVLVLRPTCLAAGIGCNRGTPSKEIHALLDRVLTDFNLSTNSLKCLASIDLKADEEGLIDTARQLQLPLQFFTKAELHEVQNIQNPSDTVKKHIGVQSVCEAAAILASQKGNLIVPKQKTRNVTVAIARTPYS
ncbi:MAG: cobalt-precorrin 5A hydrolase [Desulfobacterales bacterium]|nr:cobalt-precorrin 5A hydrolase [Desulfobacterales bacterium]